MYEKFKSLLTDDSIFIALIIVFIGVISFGLGRQSVVSENIVQNNAQTAGVKFYEAEEKVLTKSGQKVVVSKSGTKYHLPDCPGASQIKETNKVFFDSIDQVKAAGYLPAANCEGLK
jgi:hypothetical protein